MRKFKRDVMDCRHIKVYGEGWTDVRCCYCGVYL